MVTVRIATMDTLLTLAAVWPVRSLAANPVVHQSSATSAHALLASTDTT